MNCKLGDLVYYVGSNKNGRPNIYGWVGTVIKHTSDDFDQPCWKVFPRLPGGSISGRFSISHGFLIGDENLRPIRDNLGQDETLTWLDVPSTDKVTA